MVKGGGGKKQESEPANILQQDIVKKTADDDDEFNFDSRYMTIFTLTCVLLGSAVSGYIVIGSRYFLKIEEEADSVAIDQIAEDRASLFDKMKQAKTTMRDAGKDAFMKLANIHLAEYEANTLEIFRKRTAGYNDSIWTDQGAIIFTTSVVTTIGWGNITPKTELGRISCIVYAIFGIPMLFSFSAILSAILNVVAMFLAHYMKLFLRLLDNARIVKNTRKKNVKKNVSGNYASISITDDGKLLRRTDSKRRKGIHLSTKRQQRIAQQPSSPLKSAFNLYAGTRNYPDPHSSDIVAMSHCDKTASRRGIQVAKQYARPVVEELSGCSHRYGDKLSSMVNTYTEDLLPQVECRLSPQMEYRQDTFLSSNGVSFEKINDIITKNKIDCAQHNRIRKNSSKKLSIHAKLSKETGNARNKKATKRCLGVSVTTNKQKSRLGKSALSKCRLKEAVESHIDDVLEQIDRQMMSRYWDHRGPSASHLSRDTTLRGDLTFDCKPNYTTVMGNLNTDSSVDGTRDRSPDGKPHISNLTDHRPDLCVGDTGGVTYGDQPYIPVLYDRNHDSRMSGTGHLILGGGPHIAVVGSSKHPDSCVSGAGDLTLDRKPHIYVMADHDPGSCMGGTGDITLDGKHDFISVLSDRDPDSCVSCSTNLRPDRSPHISDPGDQNHGTYGSGDLGTSVSQFRSRRPRQKPSDFVLAHVLSRPKPDDPTSGLGCSGPNSDNSVPSCECSRQNNGYSVSDRGFHEPNKVNDSVKNLRRSKSKSVDSTLRGECAILKKNVFPSNRGHYYRPNNDDSVPGCVSSRPISDVWDREGFSPKVDSYLPGRECSRSNCDDCASGHGRSRQKSDSLIPDCMFYRPDTDDFIPVQERSTSNIDNVSSCRDESCRKCNKVGFDQGEKCEYDIDYKHLELTYHRPCTPILDRPTKTIGASKSVNKKDTECLSLESPGRGSRDYLDRRSDHEFSISNLESGTKQTLEDRVSNLRFNPSDGEILPIISREIHLEDRRVYARHVPDRRCNFTDAFEDTVEENQPQNSSDSMRKTKEEHQGTRIENKNTQSNEQSTGNVVRTVDGRVGLEIGSNLFSRNTRSSTRRSRRIERIEESHELLAKLSQENCRALDCNYNAGSDSSEDSEDKKDQVLTLDAEAQTTKEKKVPFLVYSIVTMAYIALGGLFFMDLDPRGAYSDGLYFTFVMLTTIGFGDIVPTPERYIALMVYGALGLALANFVTNMMIDKIVDVLETITVFAESKIGFLYSTEDPEGGKEEVGNAG